MIAWNSIAGRWEKTQVCGVCERPGCEGTHAFKPKKWTLVDMFNETLREMGPNVGRR